MTGIWTEEKLNIGGAKFTENLALLSITEPISGPIYSQKTAILFFSLLAENEINISMLSEIMDDKTVRTDCSVLEDKLDKIHNLISPFPELKERLKILQGLGTISIYPHKSRMKLLGKILFAFGKKKIPVYNMTSSISSFTFLTECDCLDKAVEALEENFMLPENHAPFQRQFCIKHVHK
jgi:aspartokinase